MVLGGAEEKAPMAANPESNVPAKQRKRSIGRGRAFSGRRKEKCSSSVKLIFKCLFKFNIFGELRSRGRRRCSLDFGRDDDGRGCARGIELAGIEVLSK